MIGLRQETAEDAVLFSENVVDARNVDVVYALRRIIGAKIRYVWRGARYIWRRIELDQLECDRVELIRR